MPNQPFETVTFGRCPICDELEDASWIDTQCSGTRLFGKGHAEPQTITSVQFVRVDEVVAALKVVRAEFDKPRDIYPAYAALRDAIQSLVAHLEGE